MLSTSHKPQNAFTLIELSIVLVIIGLVVGGVLVGQDLIKAAQLRSVATELQQYKTAVNTFKLKYNCLPGDCVDATRFFGVLGGVGCPGSYVNLPTRPGTCNGNGNNTFDVNPSVVNNHNETFGFWDHLSQAGFISGKYWGMADSGNMNALGAKHDFNVPASKLTGAGWQLLSLGTIGVSSNIYIEGNYGNAFIFGGENLGTILNGGALYPIEAKQIDNKIDDGFGGTGSIVVLEQAVFCNWGSTSTTQPRIDMDYQMVGSNHKGCVLVFKNVF